jgi:uncharacterized protein YndB with AHSA1/START domain
LAYTSIELAAPSDEVFSLLVDARSYPRWLIGAAEIRQVDPGWPGPGSRFHHRVGVGPLSLPDSSEVLAIDPDRMLRLAVRARPLVSAVVTFRLIGDGRRTALMWEEEPAERLIGNLVRPVVDPLTHVRNHRSLRRFAALLRQRQAAAEPSTTAPRSAR